MYRHRTLTETSILAGVTGLPGLHHDKARVVGELGQGGVTTAGAGVVVLAEAAVHKTLLWI